MCELYYGTKVINLMKLSAKTHVSKAVFLAGIEMKVELCCFYIFRFKNLSQK